MSRQHINFIAYILKHNFTKRQNICIYTVFVASQNFWSWNKNRKESVFTIRLKRQIFDDTNGWNTHSYQERHHHSPKDFKN